MIKLIRGHVCIYQLF